MTFQKRYDESRTASLIRRIHGFLRMQIPLISLVTPSSKRPHFLFHSQETNACRMTMLEKHKSFIYPRCLYQVATNLLQRLHQAVCTHLLTSSTQAYAPHHSAGSLTYEVGGSLSHYLYLGLQTGFQTSWFLQDSLPYGDKHSIINLRIHENACGYFLFFFLFIEVLWYLWYFDGDLWAKGDQLMKTS